jgi:hypothetical protein
MNEQISGKGEGNETKAGLLAGSASPKLSSMVAGDQVKEVEAAEVDQEPKPTATGESIIPEARDEDRAKSRSPPARTSSTGPGILEEQASDIEAEDVSSSLVRS